jgi:formylglycine-generating enzyme required for sulfatase activity
MEIGELAKQLAEFLKPALPALLAGTETAAKAAIEAMGRDGWELAKKLWAKIWPKAEKKVAAREAIEEAAQPHSDEDAQTSFRIQLKKLLKDKELAAEMQIMVGQIGNLSYAREGSVIVEGNAENTTIVTGILNNFYHLYQSAAGRAVWNKAEFEKVLQEYLSWVHQAYGQARLYGLESLRTSRGRPVKNLSDVFVPLTLRRFQPPRREEIERLAEKQDSLSKARAYLELVEQKQEEGKPIPLKSLLTTSRRLAVIGGAGSGKSTLLAYLASSLAMAAQPGRKLPFSLPAETKALIPLIIPLRYRREYLYLCQQASEERLRNPRAGTLAGFIPWYLKRRSPALEISEDFFDRLLLGGGCLLMLDGLDEVVSRQERNRVREEVESLANDIYPDNFFIVTAREAGYQEEAVFGEDFTRLDVQRLDDKQIETLVANWCQQLYPGEEEQRTGEIITAIEEINSLRKEKNLPPLVSTPLMTTMVVSVKWGETELPRERAKLYEAAVRVILQAQYIPDDPAREELVEWGGPWDSQRDWLSTLALAMHKGGQAGAAISEEQVRSFLRGSLPTATLDRFIEAVRARGGLFEERAELFQFIHLTFQEFLAARILAKQREQSLPGLIEHITVPWWREVFLLIYGFAQADYAPFAQKYLDWLSTLDHDETTYLAGLELAGAAVLELEKPDPERRRQQAERLVQAIQNPNLKAPPALRVSAGDTLARLGDPRFEEQNWYLPREPLLGFVHIPAGEFTMGTRKEDVKELLKKFGGDKEWYEREVEQHTVNLPDYFMARYPVTVAQFKAFVEESGYDQADEDSVRGVPNHPVVTVTWFDALAYCNWLTGKLKEKARAVKVENPVEQSFWQRLANGELTVTLPSEAEWEKAARGDKGAGNFPWGDDITPNHANYGDTNINRTSAVGCFPQGRSPYGLLDMSGNVWEWTRSIHDKYPYKPEEKRETLGDKNSARVVRGGAFLDVEWYVRCAVRLRLDPDLRYWDQGFRVVVSPVFH